MKKIACLACMLFLLLTAISLPAALAAETDFSGEWVCKYVDLGDGVLQTDYQGQVLQDVIRIQLGAGGDAMFSSFGTQAPGTWAPSEGGITVVADATDIPFTYTDGQLVNVSEGVTMYFVRAESAPAKGGFSTLLNLGKGTAEPAFDYTGTWNAVSYVTMGIQSDIAAIFPDGISITLADDGTGSVQLTPDYAEAITWSAADGALAVNGSNFLYDPAFDAASGALSFNYASDLIQITFEKDAGITVGPPKEAQGLPQVYTCEYFTVAFPDGWVKDEYNTYNWDTYYSAQYNLNDKDGWSIGNVRVVASIEAVSYYRDKLATLLEYANGEGRAALDEKTIGGISFTGTAYGSYWTYAEYTARIPEASLTLDVVVSSPDKMEDVLPAILDSIRFTYTVPNPPLSDPPLPEDGMAYIPSPSTVNVGGFDLKALWLPAETSILPKDQYSNSLAAVENKTYILSSQKLLAFTRSDERLQREGDPTQLSSAFTFLSPTADGTLYITDGFYTALTYKDGAAENFDLEGYLAMHPDGQWGLCFWSSSDVKKITFTQDGMASKDWILKNLTDDAARKGRFSSVSYITVSPDRIFVAGTDVLSGSTTRIAMYDFDGNELATFGSADWMDDSSFGSVSGIVQTNNGILVQDGYSQKYKLFTFDGTFIGSVSCDELLGTNYPWPCALVPSDTGALALLSQERADHSAVELLVFEITGF